MSLLNYCIRPLLRHFGRTLPIERGRTGKSILSGYLNLPIVIFMGFYAGKYWNPTIARLNYEPGIPFRRQNERRDP